MAHLTDDDQLINQWLGMDISRTDADEVLAGADNDGHFLIRKSTSAPGDYVISVNAMGSVQA